MDDKSLYAADFYESGWSRPIVAAAKAMYGRLSIVDEDAVAFEDLGVDSFDHWCIAARHAIRAFYRAAEGPADADR